MSVFLLYNPCNLSCLRLLRTCFERIKKVWRRHIKWLEISRNFLKIQFVKQSSINSKKGTDSIANMGADMDINIDTDTDDNVTSNSSPIGQELAKMPGLVSAPHVSFLFGILTHLKSQSSRHIRSGWNAFLIEPVFQLKRRRWRQWKIDFFMPMKLFASQSKSLNSLWPTTRFVQHNSQTNLQKLMKGYERKY